ncbi:site-specific integrase [Pseudomonas savastanoi]|uniref:Phage integrase n=2 Tax=Pseudomonas syringae group TaxID=136849 RepID=A0A3M4T6U0_PSEA0|nr:site-specific integrase [Pseudomonas savastanoi]RMO15247.1 Phage integrase [Pseudomonas savastanoi pv. phaseolicola]RMR22841.1 Phage integrase [Pseudomonas amygdali pv. ulmi]
MSSLPSCTVGLCEMLTSTDGYEFCKTDTRWRLNRDTVVLLKPVKALSNEKNFDSYVNTLSVFAVTCAARTVLLYDYAFRKLLKMAAGRPLDCGLLLEFRRFSDSTTLGYIRALLRKWYELQNVGVERDLYDLLRGWKVQAAIKGDAVKRLHPEEGPFSDVEVQGFMETVSMKFEQGLVSKTGLALVMLLQASGRRPWQLLNLRLKDLLRVPVAQGFFRYFVNVPRIKQRGGSFRAEFRKVEVIKIIWDVLQLQYEDVVSQFEAQLGSTISEEIVSELPLFYDEQELVKLKSIEHLNTLLELDTLHMVRRQAGQILQEVVDKCEVYSERTGKCLKVFPRRFRYTLGTRAAREGCGVIIIAELLDHSNTDNAHVYTRNVPEHGAHIDRLVGKHLTRYAAAFSGAIVESKSKAQRCEVPGSDIRDHTGVGTGTCGHEGRCDANVPMPCYTCIHFQAWLNGPHEKFYTHLVQERTAIFHSTQDNAVAAALDRTIIAVAEVIEVCRQMKAQAS